MVTDFDCWHEDEAEVSVEALVDNLQANSAMAAGVLKAAVRELPAGERSCVCANALRHAIITPPDAIAEATRERLRPILGRYLD
jgi:5'-methylthioadenosine phosphorylase